MAIQLTDEQVREAVKAARMTEPQKAALLKQAIEKRDPGARFAVVGLYLRQQKKAGA